MSTAVMQPYRKYHTAFQWVWFVVISGMFVGACVLVSGQIIRDANARALKNHKTVEIFSEIATMSNAALLILDAHGKILKSSYGADQLFTGGTDIEGRNVHDFCTTTELSIRGMDGMEKWYKASPPDSELILYVSAKIQDRVEDLVVVARTVKPIAGNAVAATAHVNFASKTSEYDTRNRR